MRRKLSHRSTGRVDPLEYFSETGRTLGLVFRDEKHGIGRNIHKSDPIAKAWHVCGIGLTVLFS